MWNSILFILALFISIVVFGQRDSFKNKTNHIFTLGINNTVQLNRDGIHDFSGFSRRQVALSSELGYLFSYKVNNRLSFKTGYYFFSFRKHFFKYYSESKHSISCPLIPILFEFKPQLNKDYFVSIGAKLAIYTFSDSIFSGNHGDMLFPETIVASKFYKGINPIISIGFGKTKILKSNRRIEWLLSYNQGTNSLVKYTFERFNPYIISSLNSKDSHFNFAFRVFLKKERQ